MAAVITTKDRPDQRYYKNVIQGDDAIGDVVVARLGVTGLDHVALGRRDVCGGLSCFVRVQSSFHYVL